MSFARNLWAIFLIPLLTQQAWAGPVDGLVARNSFLDGVLHPWFGIDHLLATLAIGLLVVHVEKGSTIAVPIVFLSSLMAGAGLNGSGIWLPWGEPIVAFSVILLGVALIPGRRYPELLLAVAVALFGIFQGYVHGRESLADSLPLAYLFGLLLGTGLLLGLGIWIGHWIEPASKVSRSIGVAIALAGLGLFIYSLVA
ncbi:HupE/UreJ family protein [Bremerella sp. P1]|uniref:HupE/UreJ family protein n=1 Tax=Bremerella sp. P1 TaxID=3026424 RepID=UPI0023687771|nr:HupE/UreJ family protein [Bremerella sp. P1]WDI44356.1 HupE/UreJ family protein [Bremerella sp. P1]